MDEPRNVPFGELEWTDDAPGIRFREAEVGDKRWATVEYGEGVWAAGHTWGETPPVNPRGFS